MTMRAVVGAMMLGLVFGAAAACAGDDKNEGDSCTQQSDCGGNLICQPISGRNQDFCCPTPSTSSTHANCSPAK
jgi:hypothetical protein